MNVLLSFRGTLFKHIKTRLQGFEHHDLTGNGREIFKGYQYV